MLAWYKGLARPLCDYFSWCDFFGHRSGLISAGVCFNILVKFSLMSASSKDFIARVDKVFRVFLGSFQDFKALSVAELAVGSSKGVLDSADRGSLPQDLAGAHVSY